MRIHQPSAARIAMVVGMLTVGWSLGVQLLQAQEKISPDSIRPPSAGLLRRLASSADAFRTGDTVYIVAADSFPYEVLGGYGMLEEARELATEAGPQFGIYGPFVTPQDAGRLPLVAVPCYKDDITTRWHCPPMINGRMPVIPFEDIDSVSLTFHLTVGDPITLSVRPPPSGFILTLDAFDRFIVPYYTRLFGPHYVAAMRDSLLSYISEGLRRR